MSSPIPQNTIGDLLLYTLALDELYHKNHKLGHLMDDHASLLVQLWDVYANLLEEINKSVEERQHSLKKIA